MKFLVLSCLLVGVFAELPRFRPARFRFQRQELAPTTTDSPTEATTEPQGPYPASGWKPAGEPFNLPNEAAPTDTYGAPQSGPYPASGWKPAEPFTLPNEPPATSYGVPDNTYGAPTTAAPENLQAEALEGPVEVQKSLEAYYVLLPNGELQKLEFVSNGGSSKYTAQLPVENRPPLLVFGP